MKKNVLLVILAVVFLALPAYAAVPGVAGGGFGLNTSQYHSYDGLICTDCHTLHNSENDTEIAVDGTGKVSTPGAGPYRELLKRGNWTDMCLSCHKEGQNTAATVALPGVEQTGWTAPIVMSNGGSSPEGCKTAADLVAAGISMPAGDFCYSNANPAKGHNPAFTKKATADAWVATSDFMVEDPTLHALAPGGSAMTDNEWSCHSCHGMHARHSSSYSAWRQLKRKVNGIVLASCGDTRGSTIDFPDMTSEPCDTALVDDTNYEAIMSNSRGNITAYNAGDLANSLKYVAFRADGVTPLDAADLFSAESGTNKNVYRGGFSSFCSACHGDFHGGNGETRTTDNAKTRVASAWVRHPTNVAMNEAGSKYGIATYQKTVRNRQGTSPNPTGYDWKYPLAVPNNSTILSTVAGGALVGPERIMCLTCHKAHASQYENMTRWDTNAHAFIADGVNDHTGEASNGDNPAFGCGKCHQKGGADAFVKF